MNRYHSKYVYAGDALRRRARMKRALVLGGAVAAFVVMLGYRTPSEASAEPTRFSFSMGASPDADSIAAELELRSAQLYRANQIMKYSSRYKIGADLAGNIFDIAQSEGIDPELGFRLVKLESAFNVKATSPVKARGLTQLMLATARHYDPTVNEKNIYEPERNLRIGFSYLRDLLEKYDGDVKIALLVYNRGPAAVHTARQMGFDPTNGYDQIVLKGYSGKGMVD